MSERTPTTAEIRDSWGKIPHLQAQFDRWFAEVQATAWDEGRESVALDFTRPMDEAGMRTPSSNPYRGGA